MRLSNLIASASLLSAAALAAPANHEHKDKRAVVTTTVQRQTTVVVNGAATPTQVAALQEDAVVNSAAPAVAATTSTAAAVADTTSESNALATEAAASPASSSSATSATSATSAQASSTGSSSEDVSDFASGVRGITYTPYESSGSCKTADEVASDLAQLTDFPVLRLYGTDCNQVENVFKAKASNQKVFLGVYYVDQIQDSVDAIKSAVESYGSWDDVTTVSIGNELVNGNQATPAQVGQYIDTGRAALKSAGYTGPVVSVDTFIAVINNPELCDYSDYMAVNAHAYFDQNTVAQDSGKWVLEQIQRVWTACDGKKDVIITESGWPSKGETYGVAVPSKENQKDAVSAITSSCGADTFLFTAFNDYWKADGAYGVEKYWGVLSNE
ncbi:scw4p [Saccharomyces arboricola H-6]|uniref:Scw4p n=1 Tax=Saccharomyces arboricola (strain H-6 / AS 2.3317 / CBS 10644) TaxID=1160507 RepID=J8PNE9_SACAR|nr:scw4p [Saccharomyces arboricola H-6]